VDGRTVPGGTALTGGTGVGQAPAGIQDPATAPAPHRGEPAHARRPPRAPATRRLPYLLVLPSVAAFVALLGYPLYQVVRISLLKLDLGELIRRETVFVGLANYRSILADHFFWSVVLRTVLFSAVSVSLTMVLATLVALLLERLGRGLRLAVEVSLVLTWAMPALTATVVWQWLFDTQFGVVNWLLTTLRLGSFSGHSWFATGLSTFAVITTSSSGRRSRSWRSRSTPGSPPSPGSCARRCGWTAPAPGGRSGRCCCRPCGRCSW
jgi:N,N'-diacetylchitobiose transport system permease protein